MITRLCNRGGQLLCSVKGAEASVRKPRAVGMEMGESSHYRRSPGTGNTFTSRDQVEVPGLIAKAIVGKALDLIDGFEVCRIGDTIEQCYGWEPRGYYPEHPPSRGG